MRITPGHINLIIAYGCTGFVILLGGTINGIRSYSAHGTIPVITEATIWLGVIGLFSAIGAFIEICSNIEDPIKEDKPIVTHSTFPKPSACIERKMTPLQSQTTESPSNESTTAPYYSRKRKNYD